MGGRDVDVRVGELSADSPHRRYGYGWSASVSGTYSDEEWLGCFAQTRYFDSREEAEEWARETADDSER